MNPDLVYLTQTDTTVGFLSRNAAKLAALKIRPPEKQFLTVMPDLASLGATRRVPEAHRRMVRMAAKRTFVYPDGMAVRVVADGAHHRFLERIGWCYSTSANRSGEEYDPVFARQAADVIVETSLPLVRAEGSHIDRLGRMRLRRLR